MILPSANNVSKSCSTQLNADDNYSVRGCFSWDAIGNVILPCILRSDGNKYVLVKIVETKLLTNFKHHLTEEMYSIVSVISQNVTLAEVHLLNEINNLHCQKLFSKTNFTLSDFIVKLCDVREFYEFLTWYNELFMIPQGGKNKKCGFLWIGSEVVSFIVLNNKKYVPLFFFIGEDEYLNHLKTKAINIKGWDLTYIKFCCIVHGINKEFFAKDECLVVSLDVLKEYFVEQTNFVEFWPVKEVEKHIYPKTSINYTQTSQSALETSSQLISNDSIVSASSKIVQPLKSKVNGTITSNIQSFSSGATGSTFTVPSKSVTNTVPSSVCMSSQMSPYATPSHIVPQNTSTGINPNFLNYSNLPNNPLSSIAAIPGYLPPYSTSNVYTSSVPSFQPSRNNALPVYSNPLCSNVTVVTNENLTNHEQNNISNQRIPQDTNVISNSMYPRTYGSARNQLNTNNSYCERENLTNRRNPISTATITYDEIIDLTDSSEMDTINNFGSNFS